MDRKIIPSKILSLFLLGVAAAGSLHALKEVLLFPALWISSMKFAVLVGGITGLGLGFVCGAFFPRKNGTFKITLHASALIPASLLAAAGLSRSLPASFLESLCRMEGSIPYIPPYLWWLAFAGTAAVQALFGLSIRLRLEEKGGLGDDTLLAVLLSGAGLGAFLFPALLYRFLGTGATLQLLALLAGGAGLIPSNRPKRREVEGNGSSSLILNVEAGLCGFGISLLFFLLKGLLAHHLDAGYLLGGIALGLSLAGLSGMVYLKSRFADLNRLTGAFLLPCAASATFLLKPGNPPSILSDIIGAALFCLPFGIAAGAALGTRSSEFVRRGAVGIWTGMLAALIWIRFGLNPVEHPGFTVLLSFLMLLALEAFRLMKAGSSGGIRILILRCAIAAFPLILSLWICSGFWFPESKKSVLKIYGPDVHITFRTKAPQRPPLLTVFSKAPFGKRNEEEQFEILAGLTPLFHPNPNRVLLLGPDTGFMARGIAGNPAVHELYWINCSGKNFYLSKIFGINCSGENFYLSKIFDLPERLFTRRTSERFDLIVVPPTPFPRLDPHPPADRAFYNEARDLLGDKGVFCQWIFPHRLDHDSFLRLLSAWNDAFAQTYLLVDHRRSMRPALALLGTQHALQLSFRRVKGRLRSSKQKALFEKTGLDPDMIAANYLTSGELLEVRLPPPDPGMQSGRIFYSRPRWARVNLLTNMGFLNRLQASPYPWFFPTGSGKLTPAKRSRRAQRLSNVGRIMQEATLEKVALRGLNAPHDLKSGMGMDNREADALSRGLAPAPDFTYLQRILLDRVLRIKSGGRVDDALGLLENCLERAEDSVDFRLELARTLAGKEQYDRAIKVLEEAPKDVNSDPRLITFLAELKTRSNQ